MPFCLLADLFCKSNFQVLQEHNDEVWFLQFSHNGKYLASSSGDHLVIIWEVMLPFRPFFVLLILNFCRRF